MKTTTMSKQSLFRLRAKDTKDKGGTKYKDHACKVTKDKVKFHKHDKLINFIKKDMKT